MTVIPQNGVGRIHRRQVSAALIDGFIIIPSKAMCGAPGKRTSSDDEVTCKACQKLMRKRTED